MSLFVKSIVTARLGCRRPIEISHCWPSEIDIRRARGIRSVKRWFHFSRMTQSNSRRTVLWPPIRKDEWIVNDHLGHPSKRYGRGRLCQRILFTQTEDPLWLSQSLRVSESHYCNPRDRNCQKKKLNEFEWIIKYF